MISQKEAANHHQASRLLRTTCAPYGCAIFACFIAQSACDLSLVPLLKASARASPEAPWGK